MESYKKPYFTLFTAVCDTLDTLEKLLAKETLDPNVFYKINTEVHRLKAAQQAIEEQVMEEDCPSSV